MLVTDRFAFLHIPKTGGSFIDSVLRDNLPAECFREVPPSRHPHLGWDELPPAAAELPVLCFVRNPWDWYVSWYHYRIQRLSSPVRGKMFATAFGEGANSFAETVRRACTGDFEHPDERLMRAVRELDVDFYTARVLTMLGAGLEEERLTVGRFERLVEDLEGFMGAHHVPLPKGFHAKVRAHPPVRASTHGSYRSYYDPALRELVASRAHVVVERFGYAF